MSRINTNPNSLIAQRNLQSNNKSLNTTLERLSTGLRVNRGKDDPAGLIASENLRAEKSALGSAISNAERADQLVNIAEGGLQELSNLLTDLRGLVTSTANNAGLSREEKQANQLQIDSILQTVDRIAESTNFQGVKLLNGNFDFNVNTVDTGVSDFRVNAAKIAKGSNGIKVEALITKSAQTGSLFLSTGTTVNLGGSANGLFTIEVGGELGSRELSFASGTTRQQIIDAVNTYTEVTGVAASTFTSGGVTSISLKSTNYGSDSFVSVKVVNDAGITGGNGVYTAVTASATQPNTGGVTAFNAAAAKNGIRDTGQDLTATINGVAATAKGKNIRVNTDFLDVEITLTTNAATKLGAVGAPGTAGAFTIAGGGAEFQLASKVDIGGKVALGIQNVAARKLGNSDVGFLNSLASGKGNNVVDGNLDKAAKIVDEGIRQISSLRGRLGAFQRNTVGSTVRNLNVSLENSSAAESVIRDADFASETANLTRSQILSQAAQNSLGLANSQPQSALALLRG
ncbi:MAG: flagellin [Phycisphaerales bacterium]|nr:flagellin [Phycisphaerales bacterium]